MKFLFSLFFFSFFLYLPTFSQPQNNVVIQGKVLDGIDKAPLAQATVKVLSLPDSALIKGTVTLHEGQFSLTVPLRKTVLVSISYIGLKTYFQKIEPHPEQHIFELGQITLTEDALLLGEAVVIGVAPEMVLKEDTVEFNADSYKLPPSAMVQDLVKKLPGVDIDEEGNITAGGKPITRILVDGKEFFGKDVAVALENINVEILNKLQIIDRKSEEARLTGVDDGEDEKVINLTIKEGMKKGWFGNTHVAAGNKERYEANNMTNRFVGDNQFSILAGINNTNSDISSGFNSSGAKRGLKTAGQVGANVNIEHNDKIKLQGSIRGSGNNNEIHKKTERENIFATNSTFLKNDSRTLTQQRGVNSDLQFSWKIDSLTRLNIRPMISYSENGQNGSSDFQTIREDSTNINRGWNSSDKDGKNLNYNVQATFIRSSAHKEGRKATLAFSVIGNNSTSDLISQSETFYGDSLYNPAGVRDTSVNQLQKEKSIKHQYRVRTTYVEPIGNGHFLQFAYMVDYANTHSERFTYNWDEQTQSYHQAMDTTYSDLFENTYVNQNLSANFRSWRKKYNYTVGFSLDPSYTNSVNAFDSDRSFERMVVNFGPSANVAYLWSKHHNIRLQYRGRTQQPSISQLQPSKNITNPLNIRLGNLDLAPSYLSMYSVNYNKYDPESQRSFNLSLQGRFTTNSIVNKTTSNEETGVTTTMPVNVNGVWNITLMNNIHIPLKDKRFKFNSYLRPSYNQRVGFTNEQKNIVRSLGVNENLSFRFSSDCIDTGIRLNCGYSHTTNSIAVKNNQEIMNYGGQYQFMYRFPFGLSLSSDLTYLGKWGYAASIDPHVFLWNAQANYEFLARKQASLFVRLYDLLQQQESTSRNVTASYIEDVEYNALTNYFMVGFAYRLNTMGGNKAAKKGKRGRKGMI